MSLFAIFQIIAPSLQSFCKHACKRKAASSRRREGVLLSCDLRAFLLLHEAHRPVVLSSALPVLFNLPSTICPILPIIIIICSELFWSSHPYITTRWLVLRVPPLYHIVVHTALSMNLLFMGHPIICGYGYHGVEFFASNISLSFTFVLGVCSIRGALWNCVVLLGGQSRAQLFTTLAPLRASLFTCSAHNAAAPCLCACGEVGRGRVLVG